MPLKPINTKPRIDFQRRRHAKTRKLKKWPYHAYIIAKEIKKGRWPEAEPYIKNDARWAYFYARDIIKGRWPEADSVIMNSRWAVAYLTLI